MDFIKYKTFLILPSKIIWEHNGMIEATSENIKNILNKENLLGLYTDELKTDGDKNCFWLNEDLFIQMINSNDKNVEKIMWILHNKDTQKIKI